MNTASETLKHARDLIAKGHTTEPLELDENHNISKVCAGTAVALAVVAGGAKKAWSYLYGRMGGIAPMAYNKDHSLEEVLVAFDGAIADAEKDERA